MQSQFMVYFPRDKLTLRRDFGYVSYSPCRLQSSQGFTTMGHSACLASNRISKRLFCVAGVSVVCLVLSFICNLLCLSSCLQIKSTYEQPWTIHFFTSVSSYCDSESVHKVQAGTQRDWKINTLLTVANSVSLSLSWFFTYVNVSKG